MANATRTRLPSPEIDHFNDSDSKTAGHSGGFLFFGDGIAWSLAWHAGRRILSGMFVDVVCALIERSPGVVLACRRRKGGHLGGFWEFPGGKVEEGEDPSAALVREIAEELAVDVVIVAAMTPVVWDYGRGPIRLLPYRCALVDGDPEALEHEEILWCDESDVGGLDWAAADVPVLEEWLRGIGH